jgi:hypothetical protein
METTNIWRPIEKRCPDIDRITDEMKVRIVNEINYRTMKYHLSGEENYAPQGALELLIRKLEELV